MVFHSREAGMLKTVCSASLMGYFATLRVAPRNRMEIPWMSLNGNLVIFSSRQNSRILTGEVTRKENK